MPAGALVTVPLPVPALVGVSAKVGVVKVAVTERAALMVTEQEAAVPVHAPLQPLKVEPAAGVAVNGNGVALGKGAEHGGPQEITTRALVTVPLPVPALVGGNAKGWGGEVAVTERAALMLT